MMAAHEIQPSFSHAVSRSAELVSCAKTALKIAKNRNEAWAEPWSAQELYLATTTDSDATSSEDNDAFVLLRSMHVTLSNLETLVKRRGHTNDPTVEIEAAVAEIEHDGAALAVHLQTTSMGRNAQHRHHRKAVQQWFQGSSGKLQEKLKEVMKHRASVLAEQTKRRQKFVTVGATTKRQFQMPPPPPPRKTVFPPPPPPPQRPSVSDAAVAKTNGSGTHIAPPTRTSDSPSNGASSIPSNGLTKTPQQPTPTSSTKNHTNPYKSAASLYANPTSSSDTGYGGGMRQRRPQQQQQVMDRQTAQRLQEAEHAERSLAELGTMFGKMTGIVAAQNEHLERIEDDVEAASAYVTAAQHEIGVLYEIRKGNRPLILKTFGLLIFLIVFLRLYGR